MPTIPPQLNSKKASERTQALKLLITSAHIGKEERTQIIQAVLPSLSDSSVAVVRQALKALQFLRLEKIPRELLVLAQASEVSKIVAQSLALIRRIQIEEKIRAKGEVEWKMDQYVFSVSDFVLYINALLSNELVQIKGEVFEVKPFREQVVFFTLKDASAVVRCWFLFAHQYKWNLELADGMEIVIKGKPQVSPKNGGFALKVLEMRLSGEGSLKLALERLKKQLESQGLFDVSRKRHLPFLPEKIGLITGENSAAYSDFVKVARDRMGGLDIYFAPVRVQGVGSISEICGAINYFNTVEKVDAIVLTRGGGSLEDLQSFNSEEVTRAVFSSRIPILVAVGHEKDWSLAELAADLRASTPSNAAELIIPNKNELLASIASSRFLAEQKFEQFISERTGAVGNALNIIQGNFNHRLGFYRSLIDSLAVHFSGFIRMRERKRNEFFEAQKRVLLNFDKYYTLKRHALSEMTKLINSYSPKNTLKRGYSVVKIGASLVRSSEDVPLGAEIAIYPYKGRIDGRVTKVA